LIGALGLGVDDTGLVMTGEGVDSETLTWIRVVRTEEPVSDGMEIDPVWLIKETVREYCSAQLTRSRPSGQQ